MKMEFIQRMADDCDCLLMVDEDYESIKLLENDGKTVLFDSDDVYISGGDYSQACRGLYTKLIDISNAREKCMAKRDTRKGLDIWEELFINNNYKISKEVSDLMRCDDVCN